MKKADMHAMKRIRSLDGLRAIAVLLVLIKHSYTYLPYVISESPLFLFISNSDLGVKIFFVLSGYLITRLLIAEKDKTGTVNIKRFYISRALRIFPIFYLYIFIVIILKFFFYDEVGDNYWAVIFVGLFLWNYKHLFSFTSSGNDIQYLGHYHTLAMEEQFYLLWPFFFSKTSKQKLIKILIGLVLLIPVIRVLTYFFMPASRGQIGMMLQTGGDAILTGCLAALLENNTSFKERFFRHIHNKLLIYFTILFIFFISPIIRFHFKGAYDLTIGMTLNNLFLIVFLFWCVNVPSFFSRVLNSYVFVGIGLISYPLYLWSPFFIVELEDKSWVQQSPQNFIIVFLVAIISYNLIEKPILRLKRKYVLNKLELKQDVPGNAS
jgi:peptidoglycan/LPS O-acetylase OafA/YrhL